MGTKTQPDFTVPNQEYRKSGQFLIINEIFGLLTFSVSTKSSIPHAIWFDFSLISL